MASKSSSNLKFVCSQVSSRRRRILDESERESRGCTHTNRLDRPGTPHPNSLLPPPASETGEQRSGGLYPSVEKTTPIGSSPVRSLLLPIPVLDIPASPGLESRASRIDITKTASSSRAKPHSSAVAETPMRQYQMYDQFHHVNGSDYSSDTSIRPFNVLSSSGISHKSHLRDSEPGAYFNVVQITSEPQKHQRKLPRDATERLRDWLMTHVQNPYPTDDEKHELMRQTGLRTGLFCVFRLFHEMSW